MRHVSPELRSTLSMRAVNYHTMHSRVNTLADLVYINNAYITGKIKKIFYCGVEFSKSIQLSNEYIEDLTALNAAGIFVHMCTPAVVSDTKIQQSYLSVLCSPQIGRQILEVLLRDERVFVTYKTSSMYYDNVVGDRYTITCKYQQDIDTDDESLCDALNYCSTNSSECRDTSSYDTGETIYTDCDDEQSTSSHDTGETVYTDCDDDQPASLPPAQPAVLVYEEEVAQSDMSSVSTVPFEWIPTFVWERENNVENGVIMPIPLMSKYNAIDDLVEENAWLEIICIGQDWFAPKILLDTIDGL